MSDDDYTESEEFPAPFVRVRGRVSRSGQVHWSPCLRTEKGTAGEGQPSIRPRPGSAPPHIHEEATTVAVVGGEVLLVAFLDYRGEVLRSAPTTADFFAKEQEWATFVARLPYHPQTQAVVLRLGERVLGRLDVPTDRPYFSLLHPNEDDYIDPNGALHNAFHRGRAGASAASQSGPARRAQRSSDRHWSQPRARAIMLFRD